VKEPLGRLISEQPAPADHQQVVGQQLHLGQQVTGDQHRPTLGGLAAQQLPQPGHPVRVQAVGRLIQQQRPRLGQQRRGQPEPLGHAKREPACPAVCHRAQPNLLQHLVHPPVRDARGGRQHPQVVAGAATRMQRSGLQHGPDHAHRAGQLTVGPPLEQRAATAADQAEHQVQGGRLAGAVRPQQAGHLARLDRERPVVHGQRATEPLGQSAGLDHRGGRAHTAVLPTQARTWQRNGRSSLAGVRIVGVRRRHRRSCGVRNYR
jgi:hypothetical protein